jgi:hypothetical protein
MKQMESLKPGLDVFLLRFQSPSTKKGLILEDKLRIDDGTSNESNNMSAIQALWLRDLIRPTVLLWLVKFAGSLH